MQRMYVCTLPSVSAKGNLNENTLKFFVFFVFPLLFLRCGKELDFLKPFGMVFSILLPEQKKWMSAVSFYIKSQIQKIDSFMVSRAE